ncbi:hypothetical protein AB0C11_19935 [Streptomyces sp. NPDC039016]|uniref:hypothetical protein n=1 Tax=Streptomyces sp. NPDC039016 TaxID=3154330 RepID=UPI003405EB44
MGPRAGAAAPALRGMRDGRTESGALRVAAADALWRITGDAAGALPVLRHYADPAPAPGTERAAADDADDGLPARARDALRRIERAVSAARPDGGVGSVRGGAGE